MKPISRRTLMSSSIAAAGASLLLGTRRADATSNGVARNLILVVASGGWDTTYALDPKPGLSTIDAPTGQIQEFSGIPVFVDPSRPSVTSLFEAYAPLIAVVNGVQTQSIVHSDCSKRLLTGTASDQNPDFGAVTAYELGRELPAPYLVLGQTSYSGPLASIVARAGTANQLGTLLDSGFGYPTAATPAFAPSGQEEQLIRDYVNARAEREKATRGMTGHNAARIQDFIDSLQRGDRLGAIADFGDFEYTREITVQAGLAVDALEQELSWAVQLEVGDWDTHSGNAQQAMLVEQLFVGLRLLLDDLATRPGRRQGGTMLDETVVAVVSEMGRTPKLNASLGKDHWPVTSAMLIGAGVSGGRVVGASNDLLEAESIDLATGEVSGSGKQLQYGNFAAGILQLVGVDPAAYLPNSEPLHAICA